MTRGHPGVPPNGRDRLLHALRWVASEQRYDTQPDAAHIGRLRALGWATQTWPIALTPAGAELLAELEAGTESRDALRIALSTSATYVEARRVLELCGDYATALAWIVARQAEGVSMVPKEPGA